MPAKAMPVRTKPEEVDRPRRCAARSCGRNCVASEDAEDADRHVDPEDPVPAEIGGEEPAERRAGERADQRRDGQPGHGRDQLVARRGADQHQARDRRHHRAADALQEARQHEGRAANCEKAQQIEPTTKTTMATRKTLRRAEPVGHPARDRDEDGERHEIGGQRQLQRDRLGADIGRDRGQRGRDHRRVHVFHEQGDGEDERGDADQGQWRMGL